MDFLYYDKEKLDFDKLDRWKEHMIQNKDHVFVNMINMGLLACLYEAYFLIYNTTINLSLGHAFFESGCAPYMSQMMMIRGHLKDPANYSAYDVQANVLCKFLRICVYHVHYFTLDNELKITKIGYFGYTGDPLAQNVFIARTHDKQISWCKLPEDQFQQLCDENNRSMSEYLQREQTFGLHTLY